MALKHVLDYYKSAQKLYHSFVKNAESMQELASQGEVTEEEVERLLTPLYTAAENYKRIAYLLYALSRPDDSKHKERRTRNRCCSPQRSRIKKRNKKDMALYQYFRDNKIIDTLALKELEEQLETFKKDIDSFINTKKKEIEERKDK